jgi:hypothetical protein
MRSDVPMWARAGRAIVAVMVEWTVLETRRLRIRFAGDDDAEALTRLAVLDHRRPPRGPVLVAEVGRRVLAGMSLDDRHAVCDPRKPTAGELVLMLLEQARELRHAEAGRWHELPRVWPRWADDELEALL